jgi:hypothetical protein
MFSVPKTVGLVICPLVYIVNSILVAGANPLFVTLIALFSDRSILIIGLFIKEEYKVVTVNTTRPLPKIAAVKLFQSQSAKDEILNIPFLFPLRLLFFCYLPNCRPDFCKKLL